MTVKTTAEKNRSKRCVKPVVGEQHGTHSRLKERHEEGVFKIKFTLASARNLINTFGRERRQVTHSLSFIAS